MTPRFHHVALIGKYQPTVPGTTVCHSRAIMQNIAQFLERQGCQVSLEAETASNTGLSHYDTIDADAIGLQCDLGLVVGGDGTMLGIGRRLARYGTPLIGINQGRLGFMTDIPLEGMAASVEAILRGELNMIEKPNTPQKLAITRKIRRAAALRCSAVKSAGSRCRSRVVI